MLLYYWNGSKIAIEPIISIVSNVSVAETSVTKSNLRVDSHLPVQTKNSKTDGKRKKIAYAITVTKDGLFLDGALVLGYGIMKLHHQNGKTNNDYWNSKHLENIPLDTYVGQVVPTLSKYDADLIAFVTPNIVHAKHILGRVVIVTW